MGFSSCNLARQTVALVLSCFLLALMGCGDGQDKPAAVSDAVDWSKVKLILGDQAKGLRTVVDASNAFDGIPYQIEWANFQGAAPLFEAVRAGAVDLAPAGDTPVLAAATGGTPLRIVAVRRGQGRSVGILVPPGSDIKTVADLKGRNVSISSARGSISQYLLIRALEDAGVKESEVNIGFVMPTDALSAFHGGKIDAWATFGIYQAFGEENGARLLLSGEGINTGLTFITASDHALADKVKRQALNDVLQRLAKAFEWARANPQQYAQVFSSANNVPLPVSQRLQSWGVESLQPVETSDVTALQGVDDLFVAKKIFPKPVQVSGLVDREVFPSAHGVLLR